MKIKEITSKKEWEHFVSSREEANFLSSWNWGVFHKNLGKKVFYRGVYKADSLVGVSLLVKETAKRGNYLTCAGGPLIDFSDKEMYSLWSNDIAQIAQKERCVFVRVRPQLIDNAENKTLFKEDGFVESPMHLTADLTLQLNLSKNTDQLLSEMRKNTRYEIKKSEKIGIQTVVSTKVDQVDSFYEHQLVLAQKHGFIPFSLTFLKTQFEVFSKDKQVALIHSFIDDTLLASAFIIFYGQEAVYHYGISTPDNQRLPGAYAVQWRAIQEAQSRGISRYNFWGIAPKESGTEHRFAGVSLFKRGFGGSEVAYLPAHDLPISKLYPVVRSFELLRAKKRHL